MLFPKFLAFSIPKSCAIVLLFYIYNRAPCLSLMAVIVISFISAKGQPKRLNLATFGMKIFCPKMMFQCFSRINMDALRSPLLIYASKNIIIISQYWQFYETKLTEKTVKRKLNSATYNIAFKFLHNMHRELLFAQSRSQAKRETCLCAIFNIWPTIDLLLVLIFMLWKRFFTLYSVAWVVEVSNICDIFLFLVFDGLPHVFSFIYEVLINTFAFFL